MFANLKYLQIGSSVLALGVFVLAARAGFEGFDHTYRWLEVTAALLASVLIVAFAGYSFFAPPISPGRAVANAVAFNTVIFVTVGFAAIVAATPRWAVGSFWGGACLLAGGFVGTLFGIPLHFDKDGTSSTNLMVDTANAASKLVAGATLAQLGPIYRHFQTAIAYLGGCLGDEKDYNSSLAGGIILYFSLAGFLAGILLPKFFFSPAQPAPPPPAPPAPAPGP